MLTILLIAGLLAVPAWVAIFSRLERAPYILLAWVTLGGIVLANLALGGPSKLLKDILIVLPAYACLFLVQHHRLRKLHLPTIAWAPLALLAVLAILQVANPSLHSPLVAMVGLKVWLLYIPLAVVMAACLQSRQDLQRFLRFACVLGAIASGTALLQLVLSQAFGYERIMRGFLGPAAAGATQNFANFSYGGLFARLPATFASSVEFYGFCMAMLALSYAAIRLDSSAGWRLFERIVLCLTIAAYVVAGSRGSVAFIPLILGLIVMIDGRLSGLLGLLSIVPALMLVTLDFAGIDLLELTSVSFGLMQRYGEGVVSGRLYQILADTPLGLGTGMNTNAARHVLGPDTTLPNLIFEGTYNKAAQEFGFLGPIALLLVFGGLIVAGLAAHRRARIDPQLGGVSAAMLGFIIAMALVATKGWQLDLDPTNVMFWMMVGILLRVPDLSSAVRRPAAQCHPFLASLRRPPQILRPPPGRVLR